MSLKQDANKLKTMNTMTAGTTPTKLETGATIELHGHAVKITHTDQVDTTVQYANLARRTFDTHALNSYLDLGIFPTDTVFERPTAPTERAVITAVTGDCCYQVRITAGSDMPRHETFTYADFIAWHMNNRADIQLETDTDMLKDVLAEAADDDVDDQPFETALKEEVQTQSEALQFGQALIDDLRTKLEIANKAVEAAEINGQIRINALLRDVSELKADLLRQNDIHTTELLAKNAEIERLEQKAAILNPAPVRKEVCTLIQVLHVPEMRKAADCDLAAKLSEGWSPLHIDVTTEFGIESDTHMRIVTLTRDLPTSPAPKVAATDAAIYSTPHIGAVPLVQRPPVQPPMPAGQVIVNLNQPVNSRPLTFNFPKPGDTRKIPTPESIEARRERHAAELDEVVERGRQAQEAIRRQSAQSPSPFKSLTGVPHNG